MAHNGDETKAKETKLINKTWVKVVGVLALIAIPVSSFLLWRNQNAGIWQDQNTGGIQKITIAQFGDVFIYAPLYIAIDAGFFQKQGLDVSLISTGGDEKTWAAVISGNASFGVADPTFVAVSESRGQPGRVIGNIVNGVPFWGVTLNPKIKVSKPQDLNGYSVATFPAPSTAYTLQRQMFIDGGLKPNIRETAFGTLLTALKAKQVDIALELEPNVSQSVLGGAKIAYSLASLYGDFALTGLTATPESLKEKPELAQKVVCGIQMSLDLARKEPKSALAILQKRFPEVDPKVAEEALKRLVNEKIIPANAITQQTAWDKAIKLRFQAGDIKNPKPFGEYVDNTFAEKAEKDCRYSPPSNP